MSSPPPSRSPSTKAVTISDETQTIPPSPLSRPHSLRRISVSMPTVARRRIPASPHLAASIVTRDVVPRVSLADTNSPHVLGDYFAHAAQAAASHHHHPSLIRQVKEWIQAERVKRRDRRARRKQKAAEEEEEEEVDSADEALDALEALLSQPLPPTSKPRRKRSLVSASDTEYASDGEAVVPECEVWLKMPEEIGMDAFKEEVLKLTHTLKCKGWRRVYLHRWKEIEVSRISGALTNAVYMVSPPSTVPPSTTNSSVTSLSAPTPTTHSRSPSPLLLRIYGPQVSHLIDRDTELSILRRLARNRIGPRLLGTFHNGRFEEFFPSRTLTKSDIRDPSTSRHIAMRLKELHTGIELTANERARGPIVWKNWDKWLLRAGEVASTLPDFDWPAIVSAVTRYRLWLAQQPSGALVFAHNDTQYGNILRLLNVDAALHLPANEHRQLIVIDFEYASANPRGFEFANHFCEWMADYHDADRPWRMDESRFPTLDQQLNFVRAYVVHFRGEEVDAEEEVAELVQEARRWRPACHAMWCAWGIVQATGGGEEEEFDYLKYAREREGLFWGDLEALGLLEEEGEGGSVLGGFGGARVAGGGGRGSKRG